MEINKMLQKLCKLTGSKFITTKSSFDRQSGRMRANVMNGIHYNKWGIRMLAKEMKKSLYSKANVNKKQLSQLHKTPARIGV